ncbi:helix-turn-helix domain-containing protein [Terrabacter sp. 2RAF25]|uniref:helix-turn-helix domain-containing protein n=1 Tax=Terrabacter sp. 2RAF25 TaxID=3232998 RepID=UPI003F9A5C53
MARAGGAGGSDDRIGRYVVRVRRLADLSQRDLAALVGATASTVSRIESGASVPTVGRFEEILAVAGLRLAVVDAEGHMVAPVPEDLVRDNQGRRFPAHLDVAPPDEVPYERAIRPRYDREAARAWFRHRDFRDRQAAKEPQRARPADHPTDGELRRRVRLMRGRQPVVDSAPMTDDCTCLDACFEAFCVSGCPRRCEPERDRFGR